MKTKISILITAAFLVISCGETAADDPIALAWADFSAGNYADAHTKFADAVATNAAEANVGLGWTAMRQDSIPEADRYFGLASADSLVHGYAGWAIVGWARNQHSNSLTRADFTLRRLPDFEFQYDTRIATETMVIIQAYDYFYLNNLSACITKIQILDSEFSSGSTQTQVLNKLSALAQGQVDL